MSADTPHLIGDCIDASMTVTLAAPKLPLVLPPGEAYAGDVVIADIGIPHDVIDGARRPARRAADAGAAAGARRAAGRRLAQGRLRPRDDRGAARAARPARRYLAGDGRAALRRRPGDCGDAGVLPADRRLDGAGVHDRAAGRTTARERSTAAAVDRVLELSHDVIACGPGLGRSAGVAEFVRALLDRATVPARARRRCAHGAGRRSRTAERHAKSATSSSRRIRARWRG